MYRKDAMPCSSILAAAKLPLLDRARKLQRLEQAVLQLLPENLRAHCKVMNLKSEILILTTTSSAWAARLRFATPDLLKQLKCQHALQLRGIQLRVEQEKVENQPVTRPPARMSMTSATLLAQTAQGVNHPALQEALYRLAARAKDF